MIGLTALMCEDYSLYYEKIVALHAMLLSSRIIVVLCWQKFMMATVIARETPERLLL